MFQRIVKNITMIIGKYATKSGTREITRHKHVKHVTDGRDIINKDGITDKFTNNFKVLLV